MGIIEYRRDESGDIIRHAKRYIEEFFAGEASGHDYYHSLRVYKLALKIAEKEGGDKEIVALAALLHDVDDYKIVGEGAEPLGNAREFLQGERYPEEGIRRILEIIEHLSFSAEDAAERTLEGQIVQDADRLDAMGAMGIARTFAYGGAHGRAIYLPNQKPRTGMTAEEYRRNAESSSLNHFYEKLLTLKDLMSTETARKMAEFRHAYMVQYLDEFYREWEGES